MTATSASRPGEETTSVHHKRLKAFLFQPMLGSFGLSPRGERTHLHPIKVIPPMRLFGRHQENMILPGLQELDQRNRIGFASGSHHLYRKVLPSIIRSGNLRANFLPRRAFVRLAGSLGGRGRRSPSLMRCRRGMLRWRGRLGRRLLGMRQRTGRYRLRGYRFLGQLGRSSRRRVHSGRNIAARRYVLRGGGGSAGRLMVISHHKTQ